MEDIKKINRLFLTNLLLFVGAIILIIGAALLAYFLLPEDIAYLIWFILLIVLMIISGMFRSRLEELTNYSYIIKIRANAGPAIDTRKSIKDLEKGLLANDYQQKADNKAYTLYYRVIKDNIKRIFKRYMLEVVVISKKDTFFIDEVDKDIDTIHAELHKEKKKTDKLFVTQIREVSELSDVTKDQIKEIAFVRSTRGVVSIVNIGIHPSSQKAILLYTDTYRPSLYYEYHVNQIKEILK